MIEKLDGIITRVVDRDRSRVYEALDSKSIIKAMNKINELVDHVNNIEQPKTIDTRPPLGVEKVFNEIGKEKEHQFGEWVSIAEKQPTKTGVYLFLFGGELTIAFYKAEIKEIEMSSGLTLSVDEAKRCAVSVHWMPLPEPPIVRGCFNGKT